MSETLRSAGEIFDEEYYRAHLVTYVVFVRRRNGQIFSDQ